MPGMREKRIEMRSSFWPIKKKFDYLPLTDQVPASIGLKVVKKLLWSLMCLEAPESTRNVSILLGSRFDKDNRALDELGGLPPPLPLPRPLFVVFQFGG
jgi:hypothetical protein